MSAAPRALVLEPSLRRSALRASALVLPALLGLTAPVAAQVQMKTLPDGTTLIYNESEAQHARRTSTRLLAAPTRDLADLLDRHARRQRLSLPLVQAVVQVESGYNTSALSSKGAMGLMQLMPATAKLFGVVDAYDPEENVRAGTAYLRQLLDRFGGQLSLALAAYNAGPTAVDRYGGIPPYRETKTYVERVLALFSGAPPPPLLQDYAREKARDRARSVETQAATTVSGSRVYLVRDANNRVLLTTTPPKSR